jgi:hypothetical protein
MRFELEFAKFVDQVEVVVERAQSGEEPNFVDSVDLVTIKVRNDRVFSDNSEKNI